MNLSLLSKSYDLRGIYPSEIDESYFFLLGRAFARLVRGNTVALGYDARVSSESLQSAFSRGVRTEGKTIVNIGLCSTDMLQFATFRYPDIDAGAMITASHNPKEYNGLKSCLKHAVPLNLKEHGKTLAATMEQLALENSGENGVLAEELHRDIVDDWVEHIASFIAEDVSGLKVVADAGNGTAGVFMPALAKRLGFELVGLYLNPDGNFPNHHPSPIESKNTRDMVAKVLETHADIGVAFDGDADRAVLCDESGEMISSSTLICAIADEVLGQHPGSTVLANAVVSSYVEAFTRSKGGNYERSMVGHVYLKEMMAKNPSIHFAGEHSSHYYFRKNHNADSGVIAFVHFLGAMKKLALRASEVRRTYERYPMIEETNFSVTDPKTAIERISEIYADFEQERFDGLTVYGSDFWFNLRPSSNEPLLRLNLEAQNDEALDLAKSDLLPHLR